MMICGAEFKAHIVCEEAIRRAAKSSKKGEKGEQRRAEKSREETIRMVAPLDLALLLYTCARWCIGFASCFEYTP